MKVLLTVIVTVIITVIVMSEIRLKVNVYVPRVDRNYRLHLGQI